jgi:hypothetical protein
VAFGSNAVGIAFEGKDQVSPVVRGIQATMDRFKRDAATGFGLGAGISVFNMAKDAFGKVLDYMGDAVGLASDLAEQQGKVDVVFGRSAGAVREWAETTATGIGMSERKALEATGTLGALFSAMHITGDAAADMSIDLVTLAADLGSFYNVAEDDALLALRSGLVGETEPMRRFGVLLNAAAVEAKALELGLAATKGEITEQMKVTARLAIIQEQTTVAQGNFADTSDGLANVTKSVNAQLEDLQANIGERVLPIVRDLAIVLRDDVLPALEGLFEHLDNINRLVPTGHGGAPSIFAWTSDSQMQAVVGNIEDIRTQFDLTVEEMDELVRANRRLLYDMTGLEDATDRAGTQQNRFTGELFQAARALSLQGRETEGTTGATEALTGAEEELEAQAKDVAAAIGKLAGTTFPELRRSGREALGELRESLEAQGDPLRYLHKETMALEALRRQAARQERFDVMAAIDARMEEIKAIRLGYREVERLHEATQQSFDIGIDVDTSEVRGAFSIIDQLRGSDPGMTWTGEKGGKDAGRRHRAQRHALYALTSGYRDVEAAADSSSGATDKKTGADERKEKAAKEAAKAEEALAREYDRVGEAATRVSEAVEAIGKVAFKDMATEAQERLAELRASLEAQIDPIRVMQDEVAQLKALRAEAEAQGRVDIMATVDLRLQELEVMSKQYQMMKARYAEEHTALDILTEKLDIGVRKAKELLETYRTKADVEDSVTDEELARLIIKVRKRAKGGPVSAGGTYLVGEGGPELLTMGSASGHVTPNHAMGGGGDVYLDGFLVGRIIDERMGRQYGTASRVSQYRRSN